jgi:hypothetical protein
VHSRGHYGSVSVRAELVLLHGNTLYVNLVDVIQTLICFDDRNSASVREEVKHLRTRALKHRLRNARTSVSEDTTIAAVEWKPRRNSCDIERELGRSEPRFLDVLHDDQLHPYQYLCRAYLFADDHSLRMEFCEWLRHQHTSDGIFFTCKLCGQAMNILRVRVFSMSAVLTSGHGIILIFCEHIKSASSLAFVLESSGHWCWGPICYVTGWLLNDIMRVWKLFYLGCLNCASRGSRQWLKAVYPGRWIGRRGPITWPFLSPGLSPMDSSRPVRTSEGLRLGSPSEDHRWPHGKNLRSCDKVGTEMWRQVRCTLASTLKRLWVASNTYCNYEVPMVWSFDSLRHLTVTCNLESEH